MKPDTSGQKLGFIWLQPGVSRMNAVTLLYICFVSIGLLVFLNLIQPYILSVMLGVPEEVQGRVVARMSVVHEMVLILLVAPFGALADRIGRRPVIVIGYLFVTAGYMAYPFATSVAMLTAFRAVFAIGAAAIISSYTTVMTDYPQEMSRGKLVAVGSLLNGIGLVLIIGVGGQLTTWITAAGYDPVVAGRMAVTSIGLSGIVSAIVVAFGLRGGRTDVGHVHQPLIKLIGEGLKAGKNPRIALAYAAAFAARGDVVVIGVYMSLWAQQAGVAQGLLPDEAQSRGALLLAVTSGSPLLVVPLLGFLNDRIDRVTATIGAMMLAVIGYFSFGLLANPLASAGFAAAIMLGVGQVAAILAGQTLIGQEADPRISGSTLGVFNLFGSAGTLAASYFGGVLFDLWTEGGPFLMMGFANFGILLAAIYVRVRHGASVPAHKPSDDLLASAASIEET